jgi:hypothetical protein
LLRDVTLSLSGVGAMEDNPWIVWRVLRILAYIYFYLVTGAVFVVFALTMIGVINARNVKPSPLLSGVLTFVVISITVSLAYMFRGPGKKNRR